MLTVIPSNEITQTSESQSQIKPSVAIQLLEKGNIRFVNGEPLNRNLHQQVRETSTGQYPFATIVSCIDSRIPTEVILIRGLEMSSMLE